MASPIASPKRRPTACARVASEDGPFTPEGMKAAGFAGFTTFAALLDGQLAEVPRVPGAYVVLRTSEGAPQFTVTSSGGHFKGRDPAVAEAVLRNKWIDGCLVVYIGKADVLQRRLGEYARFGCGEPIGHWGGRYIWQLGDAEQLLVAWRPARPGQSGADAESELVALFKEQFGRLPFANISDPSKRRPKGHGHANARPLAERGLIDKFVELSRLKPDGDGRVEELSPLVIETIDDAALASCVEDIARGDGGELRWGERRDGTRLPPSLHSVFSSCGAALNLFGPWRLAAQTLSIVDEQGFDELRLEEKLRIFRGGRAPNLDCVLWDDSRLVAIESKLCEHLAPGHSALFKDSYERVAPFAHETWRALYELLKASPDHFVYLDAAQLVRHYFGIRAQLAAGRAHAGKRAWLVYCYWEPADADAQPVSLAHRREVAELRALVTDPAVAFIAISHRELWAAWESRDSPPWLQRHIQLLRHRYDMPLSAETTH